MCFRSRGGAPPGKTRLRLPDLQREKGGRTPHEAKMNLSAARQAEAESTTAPEAGQSQV